MDGISLALFIVFALAGCATVVVGIVGRTPEAGLSGCLMAGSNIYRDIPKYVRAQFIKPFMVCSYCAVGTFIAFVAYLLLKGLWS